MAYLVCHPTTHQPFVTPSDSVIVTHERVDALRLEIVRMPMPVPITFTSATALVPYWLMKRANVEWQGSIAGWMHSLRVTAAPLSFELAKNLYELMLTFSGESPASFDPETDRTARLDERMTATMRDAMRKSKGGPPRTIIVEPPEAPKPIQVTDPRQRRVRIRK